ncbi:hypothetical protein Tco_1112888 [Tanacetum coccineum]|uniref:Uncharacterized protein n=1 Tax=Tanacetum coccineum TaxID=301880 RepID=A0ABQ5IQL1_9ASTR
MGDVAAFFHGSFLGNVEAENSVLRARVVELGHRLESLNQIIAVMNQPVLADEPYGAEFIDEFMDNSYVFQQEESEIDWIERRGQGFKEVGGTSVNMTGEGSNKKQSWNVGSVQDWSFKGIAVAGKKNIAKMLVVGKRVLKTKSIK